MMSFRWVDLTFSCKKLLTRRDPYFPNSWSEQKSFFVSFLWRSFPRKSLNNLDMHCHSTQDISTSRQMWESKIPSKKSAWKQTLSFWRKQSERQKFKGERSLHENEGGNVLLTMMLKDQDVSRTQTVISIVHSSSENLLSSYQEKCVLWKSWERCPSTLLTRLNHGEDTLG